jgi:hypothetical protein
MTWYPSTTKGTHEGYPYEMRTICTYKGVVTDIKSSKKGTVALASAPIPKEVKLKHHFQNTIEDTLTEHAPRNT